MVIKFFLHVITLSSLLLLFSCTTQKSKERPSFYLPSNQVIVLPTSAQQSGLTKACDIITREIKSSLQQQGFAVIEVSPSDFHAAQKEALDITGSIYNPKLKKSIPYNPSLYVRSLINSLRQKYVFDVAVDSAIELRPAIMTKDKAAWDGVTEKVIMHNRPKNRELPDKAKGVSVRISTMTNEGAVINRAYVGVAVPYEINFHQGAMKIQLKRPENWEPKLPAAVKKALQPFYKNVEVRDD